MMRSHDALVTKTHKDGAWRKTQRDQEISQGLMQEEAIEDIDRLASIYYSQRMGWDEELRELQIKTAKDLGASVQDFFKQFYESWLASQEHGIIIPRVPDNKKCVA